MATAHSGEIKIWDMKKPSTPRNYIHAHANQLWSLDFSPVKENHLVSSAADNTIKMWDVNGNLRLPMFTIKTHESVWKVQVKIMMKGRSSKYVFSLRILLDVNFVNFCSIPLSVKA